MLAYADIMSIADDANSDNLSSNYLCETAMERQKYG